MPQERLAPKHYCDSSISAESKRGGLFLFPSWQTAGLDMQQGVVGDMKALGVREAYKSKLQVRGGPQAAGRFIYSSCRPYSNKRMLLHSSIPRSTRMKYSVYQLRFCPARSGHVSCM